MLRQQEDWVVRQGKEERQGGNQSVLSLQESRTSHWELPPNRDRSLHINEAVQEERIEGYR